jgi:branched-subunit amino acid transport protein AzlD
MNTTPPNTNPDTILDTTPNTTPTVFLSRKINLLGVLLGILGGVIALIVVAIIVMSLFFKSQADGSGLESIATAIFAVYGIVAIVVVAVIMLAILPFYLMKRRKNPTPFQKKKMSLPLIIGIVLLGWVVLIAAYILVQWYS